MGCNVKLYSSRESVRDGEISLLAVLETILASFAFLYVISNSQSGLLLFTVATILPLGLVQTPTSRLLLRRWRGAFEQWLIGGVKPLGIRVRNYGDNLLTVGGGPVDVTKVKLSQDWRDDLSQDLPEEDWFANAIVIVYRLPLVAGIWLMYPILVTTLCAFFLAVTLIFGTVAISMFVAATIKSLVSDPYKSLRAIPANLSRVCLSVDFCNEPIIIPEAPEDRFMLTSVLRPHRLFRKLWGPSQTVLPSWVYGRSILFSYESELRRAGDLFGFLFVYVLSTASRICIKASVLMYGTVSLCWTKLQGEDSIDAFIASFSSIKLNQSRLVLALIVIAVFLCKLALVLNLTFLLELHSRLGPAFDWFIVPTSLPGWQCASALCASLFFCLFLYADHANKLGRGVIHDKRGVASKVNFVLILMGCFASYRSVCVVIICFYEIKKMDGVQIWPFLPAIN